MRIYAAIGLVLMGSLKAEAQTKDWPFSGYADALYNQCTSSQVAEQNRCIAYITAVADGFNWEDHEHFKCMWAFIAPEVSPEQQKAAVLQYMHNVPNSMKVHSIVVVRNALMAFFPCPK